MSNSFGPDLLGEKRESIDHYVGIKLLAIARHDRVAGLIDQSHDVECGGMDGTLGMLLDITNQVHAMGKLAAGRHVSEDYIPGKREERFRKLVAVARGPGDMKFHHLRLILSKACSPSCQMRPISASAKTSKVVP